MKTTKEQLLYIKNNIIGDLNNVAGAMFGLVNMHENPYDAKIHGTEEQYFDMLEEKTRAFDLLPNQEHLSLVQAATIIAAFAERFKKIVIDHLTNE